MYFVGSVAIEMFVPTAYRSTMFSFLIVDSYAYQVCDLPRRSHRDAFRHRDVQLVSAEAAFRHRDAAFTEDHWHCLDTL